MDSEKLLFILNKYFNNYEIDALCFELSIDYRNLKSHLLKFRILEMLQVVEEENLGSELIKQIKEERPFLFGEAKAVKNYTDVLLTPPSQPIEHMDKVALYEHVARFKFDYVRTIFIDVGIDETEFSNEPKNAQVRKMVLILEDKGQLPNLKQRLIDHYSGNNPILPQPKPFVTHEKPTETLPESIEELKSTKNNPKGLVELIVYYFNESDLRDLLFDLEIDAENIIEPERVRSVENLIVYFEERNALNSFLEILKQEQPFVEWKL